MPISTLTRAQVALSVVVGLLVLGVGVLLVTSYVNITTTSAAFEMGYYLADLADVQRGVAQLQVETVGNLYSRSADTSRAEAERAALDERIDRLWGKSLDRPTVLAFLEDLRESLREYDLLLARLSASPLPGNMLGAERQFVALLRDLEARVGEFYDREEAIFFASVGEALRAQRTSQALLLVIMLLMLVFGVAMALSVRARVNTQFERAYRRLEEEVAERQHAEAEQRRQAEYLSALHETSVGMMNHLDLSDLLQTILNRAVQLVGARDGFIFLADRSGEALEMAVATGQFQSSLGFRLGRGEGLSGLVLAEGRAMAVEDYGSWDGRSQDYRGPAIRALVGVPLAAGEADANGVLGVGCCAGSDGAAERAMGQAEIGILSRFAQLASIAIENAHLFAEAQGRMREIEALYRADAELYGHLNLDKVLQSLADVAVDMLQADKSSVLCWDEAGERLVARAGRGFSPATLRRMAFAAEGRLGRAVASREPVLVQDSEAEADAIAAVLAGEGVRSSIHVPIMLGGDVFGLFNMHYAQPMVLDEEERRRGVALAQRAAAALHNARLYEQAQHAATLEERQRLARELHDAVTQTLFSASLIAEVLPRVWDKNQDAGRQRLADLHALTRGALAEMRSLLMELRPASLAESALGDLLHGLAEAFAGRTRVPAEVDVRGECHAPADVKVALYRIAQEALNNIAKHAAAEHVWIDMHCDDRAVRLSVRDDGCGFAQGNASPESLGLAIMGERAADVGATVRVQSAPGEGTMVEAVWPVPAPLGEETRVGAL